MFEREKTDIADFGLVFNPGEAAEPILSKPVSRALMDWLTEIWADKELAEVGLKARKKAIFDGPPGVGKTTLAHYLAARLGIRMLAVRPDEIIDKWLGSTGKNIGALFNAVEAEEEPIVIFFDEFDAIALTRKNKESSAGEEQNAWVNTLLQRLEQHDGFVIAATNHGKSIDPAVWRRFDMHLTLELPGQGERELILERYLKPFALRQEDLRRLGEAFASASPALMRQFCEGWKRNIIIGPMVGWDMAKRACFERLLATIQPHHDLGKPRLWSHGTDDVAIAHMPWPLLKDAASYPAEDGATAPSPKVVKLREVPK